MPRRAKGPRLYLRRSRSGDQWWVILDRGKETGTGIRAADVGEAEKRLADYIADKHDPTQGPKRLDKILIGNVMNVYLKERAPETRSKDFIAATAAPIIEWWGQKTLADIRGQTCRDYVTWRTSQRIKRRKKARNASVATARHDLKVMRAAIKYYNAEYGPLPNEPKVTLPDPSPPKERWLTRAEAAKFLKVAKRYPHLRRFILVGLHTASRMGVILGLRWVPSTSSGWIDVQNGLLYRRGQKEIDTKKRRPPARIPAKLLGFLRRWRKHDVAHGITHVMHYKGAPIGDIHKVWATTRNMASLGPDVTPHTLRHTAICWQLQEGVEAWEVAGWAGLTVEMIDKVYGHHSPDHQKNIGKRGAKPGRS